MSTSLFRSSLIHDNESALNLTPFVIASVQAEANKPILIVNQQGVVSQARATINAGIRKGKAFLEVTNIE